MGFERKTKYLVLKLDDIEAALGPKGKAKLANIVKRVEEHREKRGAVPVIEAVVIRENMDCYEAAWKLVEDEVNGKAKV